MDRFPTLTAFSLATTPHFYALMFVRIFPLVNLVFITILVSTRLNVEASYQKFPYFCLIAMKPHPASPLYPLAFALFQLSSLVLPSATFTYAPVSLIFVSASPTSLALSKPAVAGSSIAPGESNHGSKTKRRSKLLSKQFSRTRKDHLLFNCDGCC